MPGTRASRSGTLLALSREMSLRVKMLVAAVAWERGSSALPEVATT